MYGLLLQTVPALMLDSAILLYIIMTGSYSSAMARLSPKGTTEVYSPSQTQVLSRIGSNAAI